MSKRKKFIIGTVLCLLLGGIIIFSLNYIEQKKTEAQQIRYKQEQVVVYFYNNFSLANGKGVSSIKVVEADDNKITGYMRYTLLINGEYHISFSVNDNTGEIIGGVFSPDDFLTKEKPENHKKIQIDIDYLGE